MERARPRPKPSTFRPEHVAARDRRYEKSKPQESDLQQIIAAFGLTPEQWGAVQPAYQAAVTEYFTNIMSELYGKNTPLEIAETKLQAEKEASRRLYNDFIGELQSAITPARLESMARQHTRKDDFLDELHTTIQMICNAFGQRFIQYIPQNALIELFSAITNDVIGAVLSGNTNITELESIQNIYNRCVENTDEHTLTRGVVLRHHDWVHAAEDTADGTSTLSQMETRDKRQQYTDPSMYIEELFATLFLPATNITGKAAETNLIIGLQNRNYREALIRNARAGLAISDMDPRVKKVQQERIALLDEPMSGRDEKYRRWEYEQFVKLMAIEQMLNFVPDCTAAEIAAVREAFDELTDHERPERYKRFGKKVFTLEFQKNPYLFLEEFLQMIGALKPGESVKQ